MIPVNNLSEFDAKLACEELEEWIRHVVTKVLKKKGAIVGISGGVDSSVVVALCTRALGKERVLGIALPEEESSTESETLARDLAEKLGIKFIVEDITSGLKGMGAYERRNEAIRHLFPDFSDKHKVKITIDSELYKRTGLNVFRVGVIDEKGNETSKRPNLNDYLQIVAASNMKQRLRMTMLYYHAELHNYAVLGTGNKNEHDQGFFVKFGDGGADLKPIIHLFKSQVYQLARYLEIPTDIVDRKPTTDTYSAEVTQEEFFFQIPFEIMDSIWSACEQGKNPVDISQELDIDVNQVEKIINDIKQKQRTTNYLRFYPLTVNDELK